MALNVYGIRHSVLVVLSFIKKELLEILVVDLQVIYWYMHCHTKTVVLQANSASRESLDSRSSVVDLVLSKCT